MITTVTFNPSIEKTLLIDNFFIDKINQIDDVLISVGGQGINVSKFVSALGGKTNLLGIISGNTGKQLLTILDSMQLDHDFVWVNGDTRTNIRIIDKNNETFTDIKEPGPFINSVDIEELKEKIEDHFDGTDIFVLTGSVQKNVKPTVYKDFIKFIRSIEYGKKVAVDARGELLKEALKAEPWLVKTRLKDFCELVDKQLSDIEEIAYEARNLLEDVDTEYFCITMGAEGLLLVYKTGYYKVTPPVLEKINPIGIGDAVVAGFLISFLKGETLLNCARYACASGAACAASDDIPDKKEIDHVYKDVKVESILF